MGQQTRSPVQHPKDQGSTFHTQERPQAPPPAKTHSQNHDRKRFLPIQQRGDMMAGSLDGRPPDVQRASQRMHEEGQCNRSTIARTHEDARNRPRPNTSCPDSQRSSHRAVRKHTLLEPARDHQTRGSSTPAQSACYINPVRPFHDTNGSTYERVRGHTCASSPGHQAATIHSKACKRVRRLKTEGCARPLHIWSTDMHIYHKEAQATPGSGDHALA